MTEQTSTTDLPDRKALALDDLDGQEIENVNQDDEQSSIRKEHAGKRFSDFELPPQLIKGLSALGFKHCTPIQAESLPYALNGEDIVGKAQTGTPSKAPLRTETICQSLLV